MEVKKPLASVARIVDKGNRAVFEPNGSYIQSIETGKKIDLVRENGTYTMEVEYMAEVEQEVNWVEYDDYGYGQGQAGFTWPK